MEENSMKKSIAILLCAILLVSLFSACSAKPAEAEQPEAATTPAAESQPQQEQAEEPAAASTEKTVITFWNGFTGTDGDVLKEIESEEGEHASDYQRLMELEDEKARLSPELDALYSRWEELQDEE